MENTLLGVAIRDLSRLVTVSRAVARYGFGAVLRQIPGLTKLLPKDLPEGQSEAPAADRFRGLLEELGPTFIKLGQILSMRTDLFSEEWIASLQKLQDDAPVVAWEDVREVVETGLGRPISELFASFSQEPLATASIGQTHRAQTSAGVEVVLKVQRPGIEEVMLGDLNLLYLAAKALEASIEELRLVGLPGVIAEFERALLAELNFNNELGNLIAMRALVDPRRKITVPEPHPDRSCRTVLTMEFFPGRSIRELEQGSEVAQRAASEIVHATCKQVLQDGIFHGDPHAGNILIGDDETLCMIDFGLVGRLTVEEREDIMALVIAIVANDSATVARLMLKMGNPQARVNLSEFRAEISRIRNTYLHDGALLDADSGAFTSACMQAMQRFQIQFNNSYAVMFKATATLEGILRNLDPKVDVVAIALPYAERLIRERYSPSRVLSEAVGGVTGVGTLIRDIPGHLDQVLHDFETGNLQIRALTPQLDGIAPGLHRFGSRMALTAFASTLTLSATLLFGMSSAERPLEWAALLVLLGALVSWLVLLGWHFATGQRVRVTPLLDLLGRRRPE